MKGALLVTLGLVLVSPWVVALAWVQPMYSIGLSVDLAILLILVAVLDVFAALAAFGFGLWMISNERVSRQSS